MNKLTVLIACAAIAGPALADDQAVREKGFEVLRACNKGYELVGVEVEFCQSYRYLEQRSVRHGTPFEVADEDEVIEYMIGKWFLYDCINKALASQKDPRKDTGCTVADAQVRAKAAR